MCSVNRSLVIVALGAVVQITAGLKLQRTRSPRRAADLNELSTRPRPRSGGLVNDPSLAHEMVNFFGKMEMEELADLKKHRADQIATLIQSNIGKVNREDAGLTFKEYIDKSQCKVAMKMFLRFHDRSAIDAFMSEMGDKQMGGLFSKGNHKKFTQELAKMDLPQLEALNSAMEKASRNVKIGFFAVVIGAALLTTVATGGAGGMALLAVASVIAFFAHISSFLSAWKNRQANMDAVPGVIKVEDVEKLLDEKLEHTQIGGASADVTAVNAQLHAIEQKLNILVDEATNKMGQTTRNSSVDSPRTLAATSSDTSNGTTSPSGSAVAM